VVEWLAAGRGADFMVVANILPSGKAIAAQYGRHVL
jgi:hypothetical protein